LKFNVFISLGALNKPERKINGNQNDVIVDRVKLTLAARAQD